MQSIQPLPQLAFGDRESVQFSDADIMSEALTRGLSLVMKHRAAEPDRQFCARTAAIKTQNARLVALASSAFHLEATGAPNGLLMIATHGITQTRREGRTFEWGKGKGALYLPPGGCRASSGVRSVIGIDVDPAAFDRVAQAMLGGRTLKSGAALAFARPCFWAEGGNRPDLIGVIEGLVAIMDSLHGNAGLISRAGIDDALIRAVALLMNFGELAQTEPRANVSRAVVRFACEYIDANLAGTITLTDLEQLTGLSRRSLQYAFRATFDCTPMQWVARRRLEAVRHAILDARPGSNLTTIAGAYFANLGEFARMYKQTYGELPSVTLKAAIARQLRS